jgi:hypothetical protein
MHVQIYKYKKFKIANNLLKYLQLYLPQLNSINFSVKQFCGGMTPLSETITYFSCVAPEDHRLTQITCAMQANYPKLETLCPNI